MFVEITFFKFHVLNNALFLSHKNDVYQPDGALRSVCAVLTKRGGIGVV